MDTERKKGGHVKEEFPPFGALASFNVQMSSQMILVKGANVKREESSFCHCVSEMLWIIKDVVLSKMAPGQV